MGSIGKSRHKNLWKSIPQDKLRARLAEAPKDKKLLICNTGVRSYEAQVTLDQMEMQDSNNLQGALQP